MRSRAAPLGAAPKVGAKLTNAAIDANRASPVMETNLSSLKIQRIVRLLLYRRLVMEKLYLQKPQSPALHQSRGMPTRSPHQSRFYL